MSAVYHLTLLDKERRTRLYTNRLISTSRSCSTTSSGVTTIRITALTYATGASGGGIISVDRATAVDHAATDSAACRPTVRVATGAEAGTTVVAEEEELFVAELHRWIAGLELGSGSWVLTLQGCFL